MCSTYRTAQPPRIHSMQQKLAPSLHAWTRHAAPSSSAPCATAAAAPHVPLPRRRSGVHVTRASASDEDMPEAKLGPNVAAGIRDVQRSLEWRMATVTRNDAINLDGRQRLLHLSVPDDVSWAEQGAWG